MGYYSDNYGFACDICGTSVGSCEDYYYAPELCKECEQAVKAAKEQRQYLLSLKKSK